MGIKEPELLVVAVWLALELVKHSRDYIIGSQSANVFSRLLTEYCVCRFRTSRLGEVQRGCTGCRFQVLKVRVTVSRHDHKNARDTDQENSIGIRNT